MIANNDDKIMTNPATTARVWRNYCQNLYSDEKIKHHRIKQIQKLKKSCILRSEMISAKNRLKREKLRRVIKELEDHGINLTFILLFKKGSSANYENYRT